MQGEKSCTHGRTAGALELPALPRARGGWGHRRGTLLPHELSAYPCCKARLDFPVFLSARSWEMFFCSAEQFRLPFTAK